MTPHGTMDTSIAIAVPTYQREQVLIDTLGSLLALDPPAAELLVADQTPRHQRAVEQQLRQWEAAGRIRLLRLPNPSVTEAMNTALREAAHPIVLFLDDDIVPHRGLIGAHAGSYGTEAVWAVAGQVLQPGQEPVADPPPFRTRGFRAYLDFPFNSQRRTFVGSVMAGNLSVRRDRALQVGGFDENFVGVAYRFETEFARRLCRCGGTVAFEPAATIRHLRASQGGTRTFGVHLKSASPAHGVGDYYFALRQGVGLGSLLYMLRRPFREVCTGFHLRRPWWIPVKLLGELRALLLALWLAAGGPRYGVPPQSAGGADEH